MSAFVFWGAFWLIRLVWNYLKDEEKEEEEKSITMSMII